MGNFDDLDLAVASFGASNKVIYDDVEKPSIMVAVPKMTYADLITGGTQDVLPWWIVDGVELDQIWVSKYQNIVMNDRAYSLPAKDPKTWINFDQALAACRKKGKGWHLNQNGVFACLNLLAQKNNCIPRGNTNWDKSYEAGYERGVNTYIDGEHKGGRIATGTGPKTWYTDYDTSGIADLCGNVWEWVSGMRIVNGEIQIIPTGSAIKLDCNMGANSTEWKAIKPDGSVVEPGTEGTLHYNVVSGKIVIDTKTDSTTSNNIAFNDLAAASGVQIPQLAIAAGVIKDSANVWATPGHRQYLNTEGERLPFRGSSFNNTGGGGVASLHLYYPRTNSSGSIGFRSAYAKL
jgi:hypothetical protein